MDTNARTVRFIDEEKEYDEVELSSEQDPHSVFVIYLSRHNHNKVIGAFGIPDSEVYTDDLELPVYKSHLSSGCTVKATQLSSASDSSDEFRRYFQDADSSARSCFPVVDANPYLRMSDSNLCSVASAYKMRCSMEGAIINLPSSCSTGKFSGKYPVGFNPR